MYRSLIIIVSLLALLSGCSSKKVALEGRLDKGLSARAVVRNHYKGQPGISTLSGRMRIDYRQGEETQGFNVSFRLEKDKAIWISAPLGVVKALITPDRVSFYNKLENEYFDGDFSYLSSLLGVPLDFQKVQNLLLGYAVFDLREDEYNVADGGGSYELRPADGDTGMKTRYQFDPVRFLVVMQQLSQPAEKRLLEIRYEAYQLAGSYPVPEDIAIIAIQDKERSLIDISYRNLEADRELRFPYNIPEGYERIVLK